MKGHNPRSFIHVTSAAVAQHIVDEGGICDHTNVALAAMFAKGSVSTIQVVRQHLESCPMLGNVRLPYRAREDVVLADPDGTITTLQATAIRAKPAMKAAESINRTVTRMLARNVDGLTALAQDAYARADRELGDALDAAALDYQNRGSLHPMTVKALAALGVDVTV